MGSTPSALPASAGRTLRERGYLYLGDHGCFGDQLWVHRTMRAQAQRTLGLVIDGTIDSGRENWFGNCSASEQTRRSFRSAEQVVMPPRPRPTAAAPKARVYR